MLALISGASSGIGRDTAKLLAQNGFDLILLARRESRLTQIKQEILAYFPKRRIEIFVIDMSSPEQIANFSRNNEMLLKRVQVLINNAGVALGVSKLNESNPKDWQTMIQVNILGLLNLTHVVLPNMVACGSGHIINIGSVAGKWTYPGGAVYCATKAAVKSLSEGLRLDLMGTSVRVTNIEPGMVETEFSEVRLGDVDKAKAVYQDMTPLTGADIANSILWCLNQPPHVNIQELVIFPTDQAGVGYVHRKTPHL